MLTFIDKNEIYSDKKFDSVKIKMQNHWEIMLKDANILLPLSDVLLCNVWLQWNSDFRVKFFSLSLFLPVLWRARGTHGRHRPHPHELRLHTLRPLRWCAAVTDGVLSHPLASGTACHSAADLYSDCAGGLLSRPLKPHMVTVPEILWTSL